MSLLLSQIGAPPAQPDDVFSWWLVFEDEDDDHLSEVWSAIHEAAQQDQVGAVALDDLEDEVEALDFASPFQPPLNDFVRGTWADLEDEDSDEIPGLTPLVEAQAQQDGAVTSWAESVEDAEEDGAQDAFFPVAAEAGPDPIQGQFEIHDEEDDAELLLAEVAAGVIAANDFVAAVCDVSGLDDWDEEALFEASWNPALDPPPFQPIVADIGGGGSAGKYGRFDTPPEGRHDDDEELEVALLVATIVRAMSK